MSDNKEEYYAANAVEKPIEIYIKGLSGLRTIGIFGVILYHMYPYVIKGGFLGVTMFFIVSGYLLAVKSEETRRIDTFKVPQFYLKRIERLYPQLIVTIFSVCGILNYLFPSALVGIKQELLSIVLGYNNIWQINQNSSYFERIASSSPFTHMWSLANELQFYLIWPVIFLIFIKATKVVGTQKAINIIGVLALVSAILMPVLYNPEVDVTRVYYGTDTRMFSFLTGAYIGFKRVRYRRNVRIKEPKNQIYFFCFLCAIVFVSYIFMTGEGAFTYRFGMFAVNIIMAYILTYVTDERLPIGKFFEKKFFKFIGNISYEMYLWMYPVIYIFHAKRWNKIPGSGILMFAIIILIAKLLNSAIRMVVKRKFSWNSNLKTKALQVVTLLAVAFFVVFTLNGAYSVAKAPEKNLEDMNALQKELEENAKILAEGNSSSTVSKPSSEVTDNEEEITDEKNELDEIEDEKESEKLSPQDRTITAIGDSVMLGASKALLEEKPDMIIDAAESRQVKSVKEILENLESQGKIGNTVILAVGTNGPFSESVGQELIDFLGKDRDIFWVNVYAVNVQWMDESNSTIEKLAEKNDNVTVIDWESEAKNYPEWFYNDKIHLREDDKGKGQTGYANFVINSIMKE